MKLRVKEICKEQGKTLEQLAEIIGIARVNLTKAINGNPTVSTLENIANALEVNITDLFEPNKGDFTALIDYNGKLYRFDSIEQLEQFIAGVKAEKE